VAVVSTGAELVAPGEPVQPGQIHDSNSYLLAALVDAAGGHTAYRGSIGDHPDEVRALLDRLATEVDVIVTTGGVSMGVHDVVKAVLRERGEVDFVTVAMQPGKPQGFGVLGERRVPFFGLPGNPVSAFVSFEAFVRPLLRRLLGLEPALAPTTRVRLTAALRSPAGRMQFARATVSRDPHDGRWLATPVAGQGSHFVADLAAADALLLVPAEVTHLQVGDEVESILL
jgi:molybdenum cofactor synthesis domain-containing protein